MNCSKCSEKLTTDFAECGLCHGRLHFDCAGLTETTYRKKGSAAKAAWRCINCRNIPLTDTGTTADVLNEIKSFRNDFNLLKSDINTIKSDVHATSQGLKDLNTKWSELETWRTAMDERLVQVEDKVSSLGGLPKSLHEACETIESLKSEINSRDQFSRLNNVEISGLPFKSGENLNSLLTDISNKLGVDISNSDIDTIHRVRRFSAITATSSGGPAHARAAREPAVVVRSCSGAARTSCWRPCGHRGHSRRPTLGCRDHHKTSISTTTSLAEINSF